MGRTLEARVANTPLDVAAPENGTDVMTLGEFTFSPKDGMVYTVTRGISASVNQNYDAWPVDELRKSYQSFINRPCFVNHVNEDPTRTRGIILDAAFHEEDPDDVYVSLLIEVDAESFPRLAHEIVTGGIDGVSMGAIVGYTVCSICGNECHSGFDFCDHISLHKGRKVEVNGEEKVAYEICHDIEFFEISFVFDPADETALLSGVFSKNSSREQELVAPAQVDTWRDETPCPICGYEELDEDGFCSECGFLKPPDAYDEPNLELAKQVDLRQEAEEGSSAAPDSNVPNNNTEESQNMAPTSRARSVRARIVTERSANNSRKRNVRGDRPVRSSRQAAVRVAKSSARVKTSSWQDNPNGGVYLPGVANNAYVGAPSGADYVWRVVRISDNIQVNSGRTATLDDAKAQAESALHDAEVESGVYSSNKRSRRIKRADSNGWSNEDTYAMALVVDNDYSVYSQLGSVHTPEDLKNIASASQSIAPWVNLDNVNWQEIFDSNVEDGAITAKKSNRSAATEKVASWTPQTVNYKGQPVDALTDHDPLLEITFVVIALPEGGYGFGSLTADDQNVESISAIGQFDNIQDAANGIDNDDPAWVDSQYYYVNASRLASRKNSSRKNSGSYRAISAGNHDENVDSMNNAKKAGSIKAARLVEEYISHGLITADNKWEKMSEFENEDEKVIDDRLALLSQVKVPENPQDDSGDNHNRIARRSSVPQLGNGNKRRGNPVMASADSSNSDDSNSILFL